MPDVVIPGQREREARYWQAIAKLSRSEWSGLDTLTPVPAAPHSIVHQVPPFRDRVVCATCALVMRASWETFTARHEGHKHVIRGAYLPPLDAPDHPWLPFHPDDMGACAPTQGDTDAHSATDEAPSKRPAGLSPEAVAKGRSRDTPSRSPEARRAEYVRGKRRAAQSV